MSMENQNITFDIKNILLDNSGIPIILRDIDYTKLTEVNPKLIEICRNYVQEFPKFRELRKKGLFLYSPTPGNAKTSLSICILKDLIFSNKIRRKASFISFLDLISFMRKKYIYHEEFDVTTDLEDVINRSEIILLDDVGKQITDRYAIDYFFSIVNSLYEKDKIVIMTSNFSLSGLKSRFEVQDEIINSILSRIESLCTIIKLQNKDYRNTHARSIT